MNRSLVFAFALLLALPARGATDEPPRGALLKIEKLSCPRLTVFDDGSTVIVVDEKEVRALRLRPEVVIELRAKLAKAKQGSWLSYVHPGLQELTLSFRKDDRWRELPVYQTCGPLSDAARELVTRDLAEIVRLVLEGAEAPKLFADCGCHK